MKAKVPLLLILYRLILAPCIILLSIYTSNLFPTIAVFIIVSGLVSDIFDGILARRWGVSTTQLRRWDSTVDQIFFIAIVVAAYIYCPSFFAQHMFKILLLLAAEALCYLVSFIKFKKEVATHSLGAKIWTLSLVVLLIQVFVQCSSTWLFELCFYLGMLTRFEIIAILFILKKWTNDVPTYYHAVLLRKGKTIKRNKYFNG